MLSVPELRFSPGLSYDEHWTPEGTVSPIALRHFVPDMSSRPLLGLLAVVLALAPVAVRAEVDVFGLGNGQHGSLQVRTTGTVINDSTPLTAEALAGASELRVTDVSAFAAGELVLVLQMGSDTALPGVVETDVSVELVGSGAGRWELARLASVAPGVLRLTAPLVNRFATVSQVVRVPEYSDVRISTSGSSLQAPPWNGRNGGVLAFLVTGTVFNQGSLVADGAGFRGGVAETGVATALYGCAALNGPVGSGGASGGGTNKGEGLASASAGAPTHGHGRLGNAGGGGNCHDAGGGGGGHVGRGGRGGNSGSDDSARVVGGHGGAALRYQHWERLLLGGGGGAGLEGTNGGAGGGIIFFRARELQGPRPRGFITANGATPLAATHGGGGGGGAGGTVHVRIETQFGCTGVEARGGAGANSDVSPGGGGGGGRLFIQGVAGVEAGCVTSVNGGLAGSTPTAGNWGAEPVTEGAPDSAGGSTTIDQGFTAPTVTWVSPGRGAVDVDPSARLEGKTAPGATVQVFIDGAPLGSPVVADSAGGFAVEASPALAKGPHEARAWAEQLGVRGGLSEPLGFTVGDALALRVGFGCGAVPVATGSGLGALGLVVLAVLLGRSRKES